GALTRLPLRCPRAPKRRRLIRTANARSVGGEPTREGEIMRSKKLLITLTAAAALILPVGISSAAASPATARPPSPDVAPAIPGTSSNFELIGRNPLYHRGMNAAAAVFGNYLYVGNRTDGSNTCADGTTGCDHPHPGILILNIADPTEPDIVGEIGP